MAIGDDPTVSKGELSTLSAGYLSSSRSGLTGSLVHPGWVQRPLRLTVQALDVGSRVVCTPGAVRDVWEHFVPAGCHNKAATGVITPEERKKTRMAKGSVADWNPHRSQEVPQSVLWWTW